MSSTGTRGIVKKYSGRPHVNAEDVQGVLRKFPETPGLRKVNHGIDPIRQRLGGPIARKVYGVISDAGPHSCRNSTHDGVDLVPQAQRFKGSRPEMSVGASDKDPIHSEMITRLQMPVGKLS